mgnify:CR=1 FL=1
MIKNLQLYKTKGDNYILVLDNFKGVLREYIYRDIVQTSPNEEALIEIYLENTHKKYGIAGPVPAAERDRYSLITRPPTKNVTLSFLTEFQV